MFFDSHHKTTNKMSSAASLKSNRSSSSSSSQTQPPQSEPEPEVQHSLRQFLVLLLARLVEPIAYVIPFVFINQSELFFGVPPVPLPK